MSIETSHFCSHENGKLTTMICVDDLPEDLEIEGAPRTIQHADTQGMTSCGVVASRKTPWAVKSNTVQPQANSSLSNASVDQVRNVLNTAANDPNVPVHHRTALKDLLARHQAALTLVPANTRHGRGQRGQPGVVKGVKQFCSFWLRHGECDYAQQGCMYKHEMPLTAEGLEAIGLREIPRWYREKYNVPPVLRSQGHFRAIAYQGNDDTSIASSYQGLTPRSNVSNLSGSVPSSHNNGNGHGHGHGKPNYGKPNYEKSNYERALAKTSNNDQQGTYDQRQRTYVPSHSRNTTITQIKVEPETTSAPQSATSQPKSAGGDVVSNKSAGSFMPDMSPNVSATPVSNVDNTPNVFNWRASPLEAPTGAYPAGGQPLNPRAPHIHALGRMTDANVATPTSPPPPYSGGGVSLLPVPASANVSRAGPSAQTHDATYRRTSRRLFDYGGLDGANDDDVAVQDSAPTVEANNTPSSGTYPVLSTMGFLLRQLRDESSPITSWDVLFNFGPIGEDVILPSMIEAVEEIEETNPGHDSSAEVFIVEKEMLHEDFFMKEKKAAGIKADDKAASMKTEDEACELTGLDIDLNWVDGLTEQS